MVHLLTFTICFITAALSFHTAPPLNSRTNIYPTLIPRKSYSWNMPNLYLTPFSSPDCTGKSLLDANVQYDAPNIPFLNEPTWVIQPYLINRPLIPREQLDFSASVNSPTDPLSANESMATKRRRVRRF